MAEDSGHSRRRFLLAGTVTGSGLLMAGVVGVARAGEESKATPPKSGTQAPEEISPAEDLMREHGVLNRILLIYEESCRRLDGEKDLRPATLAGAAKIVRTFIEDYHAKLEEDQIFPRFEKAGRLVSLVQVLREQHEAGRRLTDQIARLATPAGIKDAEASRKLHKSLRQFIRMYRPHESREDTVLFPAIRSLMTPKQYDDLGEQFEDREHQLFGEHGFENIVGQVAHLETTLGLDDLSRFTAKP
jgi:hemerythrin-like domain-containing protein